MESFDEFFNFVKSIHEGKYDTKSIEFDDPVHLLEVIKNEPDTDFKDILDEATDIMDTMDTTLAVKDDDSDENCTSFEESDNESTIRQPKRRRMESPSTSTDITSKKSESDSHSSLLSKFFKMSCDLCDTLLLSFQDTNKHYKEIHDLDKGYLICCSKKFYRLQQMLQHCEWHINPEIFKLHYMNI